MTNRYKLPILKKDTIFLYKMQPLIVVDFYINIFLFCMIPAAAKNLENPRISYVA